MKTSLKFVCAGCLSALMISANAQAESATFIAADDKLETRICVSAAENKLAKTKYLIRQLTAGNVQATAVRARFASDKVNCNDVNLVQFTAQYGAETTFSFFNKYASPDQRFDDVSILDIARNKPQDVIIIVKAR